MRSYFRNILHTTSDPQSDLLGEVYMDPFLQQQFQITYSLGKQASTRHSAPFGNINTTECIYDTKNKLFTNCGSANLKGKQQDNK